MSTPTDREVAVMLVTWAGDKSPGKQLNLPDILDAQTNLGGVLDDLCSKNILRRQNAKHHKLMRGPTSFTEVCAKIYLHARGMYNMPALGHGAKAIKAYLDGEDRAYAGGGVITIFGKSLETVVQREPIDYVSWDYRMTFMDELKRGLPGSLMPILYPLNSPGKFSEMWFKPSAFYPGMVFVEVTRRVTQG